MVKEFDIRYHVGDPHSVDNGLYSAAIQPLQIIKLPIHLKDNTPIDLPFDEIISGLNLVPRHHTAALYPQAALVALDGTEAYTMLFKSIAVGDRLVSRMVFKKVPTTNSLVLRLGQRDQDEWEVVNTVDQLNQAHDINNGYVLVNSGGASIDSPVPPPSPALTSLSNNMPNSSVSAANGANIDDMEHIPFVISPSDVLTASVLCMAVQKDNPIEWLTGGVPASLQTATTRSISKDRVLSAADATLKYVLTLTSNVQDFDAQPPGTRIPPGETLWVTFYPSQVGLTTSDMTVMGEGQSELGPVHGSLYKEIESIVAHLRVFAAECNKREQSGMGEQPGLALKVPRRIIFNGYSIGGALAQLACLQLLTESIASNANELPIGSIGFASPMVVCQQVQTYAQLKGWNNHFLTVVNENDPIPNLLTSSFEYDLDNQHVASHFSRTNVCSTVLTTLYGKKNVDEYKPSRNSLRNVNVHISPHRRLALPKFFPLGDCIVIRVQKKDSDQHTTKKLDVYNGIDFDRSLFAQAVPGEPFRLEAHDLNDLAQDLKQIYRNQYGSFCRFAPVPRHVISSSNVLKSCYLPVLEICNVEVTQHSVLVRLNVRNRVFLSPKFESALTWTVEDKQIVPPSFSAACQPINNHHIEVRILAKVVIELLLSSSSTCLKFPSVFRESVFAQVSKKVVRQVDESDNYELNSLSDKLFTGGLLRSVLEAISALQHQRFVSDEDLHALVEKQLADDEKMILYKELFSIVLGTDQKGEELQKKVRTMVVNQLKVRDEAIRTLQANLNSVPVSMTVQQYEQEVKFAIQEAKSAAGMDVSARDHFMRQITPLIAEFGSKIRSPGLYELNPSWLRWFGRGMFKVVKVTGYASYAMAGVLVLGGVLVFAPMALGGAAVGALAADVAIDAALIGADGALRHLVGSAGESWCSNIWNSAGGNDATSAYRCHLLMLLAALSGNDAPRTSLFTANDIESAIQLRIKGNHPLNDSLSSADSLTSAIAFRQDLHHALVIPQPASFVRSDENTKAMLDGCFSHEVLKTARTEDKESSLKRFTMSSQIKALRFLRVMGCIHQLREQLSNSVYLTISGTKDVGKSSLVHSMFGIPTKRGSLKAHTTIDVNMYPLMGPRHHRSKDLRLFLIDNPGVADPNQSVGNAFFETKTSASLHIVLGNAVIAGGITEAKLLSTLYGEIPALVVLNHLEDYHFPDYLADGEPPLSFYQDHLAKVKDEAADRLKIVSENIFLLYNEQLYKQSTDRRLRAQYITNQKTYLDAYTTTKLKDWLAERISALLAKPKATVRSCLDYHYQEYSN